MTFIRAWVRSGYLRPEFTLDKLELVPQYSPLVLFLCALAAGAGRARLAGARLRGQPLN